MPASRSQRLVVAILVLLCGCKRKLAPANQAVDRGGAANAAAPQPHVRKTIAELTPPPLSPPSDANTGDEGLRWQVVVEGDGTTPAANDAVQSEVTMWQGDGTLLYSSYQVGGPVAFTFAAVAPPVARAVANVKSGSKVHLWLPASLMSTIALSGHKPNGIPVTDLIIEYEPFTIEKRSPPVIASAPTRPNPPTHAAYEFPLPDAAGPPRTAEKTANGLRYLQLKKGTGTIKPAADSRIELLLTAWPIEGLVLGAPALKERRSATTLPRAPSGLSQVLAKMTEGEVVRVWLPANKADQVVPVEKGREAVLDLTLEKIESSH